MSISEIKKNLIAEMCVLITGACGLTYICMMFASIAISAGWSEDVLPLAVIAGVIVPVIFSVIAVVRIRYYLQQLENNSSKEQL